MLLVDRGHDPWRRRNGLRVLGTRMTGFKVVATDDKSGLGGGDWGGGGGGEIWIPNLAAFLNILQ